MFQGVKALRFNRHLIRINQLLFLTIQCPLFSVRLLSMFVHVGIRFEHFRAVRAGVQILTRVRCNMFLNCRERSKFNIFHHIHGHGHSTVGLPLASIVFWIFSRKSCTHRWLPHARSACDSSMPTALVWPFGRFCTFVVSRCAFLRACSGCPCSSTIYHSVCIERVALPSLDGTTYDRGNLPLTWIFSHKCHKYALRRVRAPSKCAFSMFAPIWNYVDKRKSRTIITAMQLTRIVTIWRTSYGKIHKRIFDRQWDAHRPCADWAYVFV